jgi:hypothetical protein
MEDKQLGVASVRLASAIEDGGGERRCDVAHGKADDECACKYLIFLQRRFGHACERGFLEGFGRDLQGRSSGSRRITGAQMLRSGGRAAVCSPSIPMPALLERLASTLLPSIPDPFLDTAIRTPRPAKDTGKLTF